MSSQTYTPKSYVPAKTWPGRVWNFTKQMFPLYPNVLIFLLQFNVNYLILQKYFASDIKPQFEPLELIVGSLSLVFFVYLFRVFDEIKDYPTDLINFPDRPLVVGVLSLQDIQKLSVVLVLILLGLHLPFWGTQVFRGYLIVMIFTLLASRWFFAEKFIRPSLPLALVTHNPIVYLYQYYILCYFGGNLEGSLYFAGMYLLGEAIPGTAWEISRKIRGTTEEDNYTTYSKIWGPVVPTLLVAVLLLVSIVLLYFALIPRVEATWAKWMFAPLALIWLSYVAQMVSYWRDHTKKRPFRIYVEVTKFLILFIMIVLLFI